MSIQIIETADGSHSLFVEMLNETYHSRHGAIQEALHVFINAGLKEITLKKKKVSIFEVGFGTGLNALLTSLHATGHGLNVAYHSVEKFPVDVSLLKKLNYTVALKDEKSDGFFNQIHEAEWGSLQEITPYFFIRKIKADLAMYEVDCKADLIYYDAFGPRAQGEMWKMEHFEKMYEMLHPEGLLVTYCCKGQVRRDMVTAGFRVEKIPGPPGKREMLRAWK